MSSYNTGATNADTGAVVKATGTTVTVPSGVAIDDQIIVVAGFFIWSNGTVTDITCTAASGHAWTKVGSIRSSEVTSGLIFKEVTYIRKATSGDASDVLTFNYTGTVSSPDQIWWTVSLAAYTGFPGGVEAHTERVSTASEGTPIAYPDITTGVDGCWVVYLGLGGVNSAGDTAGAVTGTTQRQHHSNSGITTTICDTGASVGNAGTSLTGKTQAVTGGGADWIALQTLSLSPSNPTITGAGSIAMHKMGLSAAGHAPVLGTGSIQMKKMAIHIQGRLPGVGAVRMKKMGLSGTGHAPVVGTGSIRLKKMALSGTAAAGMSVIYASTDGNGVDTYNVTAIHNGPGTMTLRVLNPTSPAAGYGHSFMYSLDVEANAGTTFGRGLNTMRVLGAHNSYNMTIVEPSFAIDPWYGDHPTNSARKYETFMVELVTWVKNNLATSGVEKHNLIGFSKSGIGGQGLILNNPSVFDKCISWDFPADMSTYNQFSGNSELNYGDDTTFQARYRLNATNLAARAAAFLATNRLYVAGGHLYTGEVTNYAGRLTTQAMLHTYPTDVDRTHDWDSGWVDPALVSVMILQVFGTGSIRMKKMGLTAIGRAPVVGTGSIRMKKMGLSSTGHIKLVGAGSIRMHKMRIVTPPFATHQASNIFVFTDV